MEETHGVRALEVEDDDRGKGELMCGKGKPFTGKVDSLAHPGCPACQRILDAASHVKGDDRSSPPKSGDLTVCAYCGEILTFVGSGKELTYRVAIGNEREPQAVAISRNLRAFRAKMN